LRINESYENPDGIVATAGDLDLERAYTYTNFLDEEQTEPASDGYQWAFLDFEATNDSGSSEFLPLESDISLIAGNQQFDSVFISKEEGKYEGGEVQPGITRSGWIAYEVPENLDKNDFSVAWSGSTFDGEWAVRWNV
jgi:hypothetical protein